MRANNEARVGISLAGLSVGEAGWLTGAWPGNRFTIWISSGSTLANYPKAISVFIILITNSQVINL